MKTPARFLFALTTIVVIFSKTEAAASGYPTPKPAPMDESTDFPENPCDVETCPSTAYPTSSSTIESAIQPTLASSDHRHAGKGPVKKCSKAKKDDVPHPTPQATFDTKSFKRPLRKTIAHESATELPPTRSSPAS